MKIHEYQARDLLKKAGLSVPDGWVTIDIAQAKDIAKAIGFPVVLKSQVLVGGRGKAGGIKIVKSEEELEKTFPVLKSLIIKGYPVKKILITRAVDIKKEFYAAVTIDNARNDVVLILSLDGGVDIEETAQKNPEKIFKFYLEGERSVSPSRWMDFIRKIFQDEAHQQKLTKVFQSMLNLFFQLDCTLVEVNPLIIDMLGEWYAIDAKMLFDDNALFRHPEIAALRDMDFEDPDEIEAKTKDLSFVKLDGNIGCIVNGAGLAMATTDAIKLFGGDPANFLDVGGSSNPEKVLNALKIILRNSKIKAILINIFGGITRCDDIAKGIIAARSQMQIPVPLVIRLTGTNEKEAVEILSKESMKIYTSMREAVKEVVELAKR